MLLCILVSKLISYVSNFIMQQNWLPRRVMSAWRVAGILHALEGWNVNECGNEMFSVEKIRQASLQHGFRPLKINNLISASVLN